MIDAKFAILLIYTYQTPSIPWWLPNTVVVVPSSCTSRNKTLTMCLLVSPLFFHAKINIVVLVDAAVSCVKWFKLKILLFGDGSVLIFYIMIDLLEICILNALSWFLCLLSLAPVWVFLRLDSCCVQKLCESYNTLVSCCWQWAIHNLVF